MKSLESEPLPQRKQFIDSKERGVNEYTNDALRLLGKEFHYLDVSQVFNKLNRKQADELFGKLRGVLKEATAKKQTQEQRIQAKKEWLDWAASQADIYRAGEDRDKP
jgi:hypothetical protein